MQVACLASMPTASSARRREHDAHGDGGVREAAMRSPERSRPRSPCPPASSACSGVNRKYESRIGSSILLVRIISVTPSVAVIASSRTISISTNAITMKPSALASSAIAPGMKSFWNEMRDARDAVARRAASRASRRWSSAPRATPPIEKIRNGTRIDMGSSAEAEDRQQAEQPDHRHDGADERQHRELQRARYQ